MPLLFGSANDIGPQFCGPPTIPLYAKSVSLLNLGRCKHHMDSDTVIVPGICEPQKNCGDSLRCARLLQK